MRQSVFAVAKTADKKSRSPVKGGCGFLMVPTTVFYCFLFWRAPIRRVMFVMNVWVEMPMTGSSGV